MSPIVTARPRDPALAKLLEQHPLVSLSEAGDSAMMDFAQGSWWRSIAVGSCDVPLRGLVELVDNNPLVCADAFSVPSAVATLGLIALGPLFRAGIVHEPPILQTNAEEAVDQQLVAYEGMGPVEVVTEERDLGGVLAAQAMAIISTPSDWDEIDALYGECFGRSFYVRLNDQDEWHASLVKDRPWAVYRLRCSPDEPTSLLTIQVMADRNGKCGAAQIVHAMNVMAGFEECLGIPDSLSFA